MIIWRGCWVYNNFEEYYRIELIAGKYVVKRTRNLGDKDTWERSQRDSEVCPKLSTWYGFSEDRLWRLELLP